MKKFIKNNAKVFISIIISAVIFTSIGVYAASYMANDITYNKNGQATVEDALNDLYNNKNKDCSDIILSFELNSKSDGYASSVKYDVKNYGSFIITNGFANTNGNRTLTVLYNNQTYKIQYSKSLTLQVVDGVDIVTISGDGTSAGYTASGRIEKKCAIDNNQ